MLFIGFLIVSCESEPTMEGLWVVKSVTAGEREVTPNARWMRFNNDFTQQSGNGWFQHSVGTWQLNPSSDELTITNTNGLDDQSVPFKVTLSKNEMAWKRMEEGLIVEVKLERANQLPTTSGDQLLGLWKLEKAVGDGKYFSESEEADDYLYFGWDKRFKTGSERGQFTGVYHVHGHRAEVELIPYRALGRNSWSIKFGEHVLELQLLDTDSTVIRSFKRIHDFPQ